MTSLYCVDKKQKVRVFEADLINIELDWYTETCTGLLGGKLIRKQIKIRQGKQGRTIREQAELELNSLVNDKINEGYKSLAALEEAAKTLPKGQYEEYISVYTDGSHDERIKALFTLLNIEYNTNKDWYPLPMLAEKWNAFKEKVKYPVFVQPKLNGVRCLAFYTPNKKVKLMSRGGEYYSFPRLEAILADFYLNFPAYQNVIFDGEIYKHNIPLQEISGLIRTEKDIDLFHAQSTLEYWIYDIVDSKVNQIDRNELRYLGLSYAWKGIQDAIHYLRCVPDYTANNEEAVLKLQETFLADGYEGAIVRNPESTYKIGFRDACLLKVKVFQDSEFEIVGVNTNIDTAKIAESFVFILKNDINDLTFEARPTGTLSQKLYWYKHRDNYIGKKATVRYHERSKDGLPLQGHVRHKDSLVLIEAIRDYGG